MRYEVVAIEVGKVVWKLYFLGSVTMTRIARFAVAELLVLLAAVSWRRNNRRAEGYVQ